MQISGSSIGENFSRAEISKVRNHGFAERGHQLEKATQDGE
jgi:hypothetical protein